MVIYITAPPKNKQPKKIIRRLHPLASRPPPASSPHVAPALFVWSSVCLFLWLVVVLSLCPLLSPSHPIASPHHVVALHLVSCRPSHLVVIESSCRCISSRLVPPLSSQDVDIDALVAHLPLMARCLLGDVYECICFGLVTVKGECHPRPK